MQTHPVTPISAPCPGGAGVEEVSARTWTGGQGWGAVRTLTTGAETGLGQRGGSPQSGGPLTGAGPLFREVSGPLGLQVSRAISDLRPRSRRL